MTSPSLQPAATSAASACGLGHTGQGRTTQEAAGGLIVTRRPVDGDVHRGAERHRGAGRRRSGRRPCRRPSGCRPPGRRRPTVTVPRMQPAARGRPWPRAMVMPSRSSTTQTPTVGPSRVSSPRTGMSPVGGVGRFGPSRSVAGSCSSGQTPVTTAVAVSFPGSRAGRDLDLDLHGLRLRRARSARGRCR